MPETKHAMLPALSDPAPTTGREPARVGPPRAPGDHMGTAPSTHSESALLREAQRDIKAILDNLPAMIGYWDADLRNRMANHAYVEWFGFTPEQMYGLHISEVLGPRLFELNLPYMQAVLRGDPQLFDRTIVDTRGVTRHTQASYIPDRQDGEVRGFFVLVTDITERKKAEEALALAHTQLAEQAGELHRANADLERFAAVAAHDLRNPLVAIAGFAEMLEHRIVANRIDDKAAEMASMIGAAAQQGLDLIRDLLDFARLGSTLAIEPVDLAALARSVADDLTAAAQAGGSVTVGPLPVVPGDPAQLRQLFTNLIGNALKFVPAERSPRVEISADPPDAQHGRVVVRVCDNGVGIPAHDRAQVFQVFARGSSAADFPGTGIGLAICERVVDRHGGRIWIDDAPDDRGTCIAFSLPTVAN